MAVLGMAWLASSKAKVSKNLRRTEVISRSSRGGQNFAWRIGAGAASLPSATTSSQPSRVMPSRTRGVPKIPKLSTRCLRQATDLRTLSCLQELRLGDFAYYGQRRLASPSVSMKARGSPLLFWPGWGFRLHSSAAVADEAGRMQVHMPQ